MSIVTFYKKKFQNYPKHEKSFPKFMKIFRNFFKDCHSVDCLKYFFKYLKPSSRVSHKSKKLYNHIFNESSAITNCLLSKNSNHPLEKNLYPHMFFPKK